MSSLGHTAGGLKSETPSTSETAVGGNSVIPKDSQPAADAKGQSSSNQSSSMSSSKPGSAEAAAEVRESFSPSRWTIADSQQKLYEERMEDEYAKREGGA